MIYKIEYSKNSLKDLKAIYEYIAFELLAPITASNQVNRIMKEISFLRKTLPTCIKFMRKNLGKQKESVFFL